MSSKILVCLALGLALLGVLSNGSLLMPTDSFSSNNISAVDTIFVAEERKSCADVQSSHSGVYLIQPQFGFSDPFLVFCDLEYSGGGWTVIQNRFDGSVDFYRGWAEYENGFGDMQGEFWLGLRKIQELTGLRQHELHVVLEDFDDVTVVAKYSHFLVGGPGEKYKLNNLGSYSGLGGDSLSYAVNQSFSTLDADNDSTTGDCAKLYKSGWWFNACRERNEYGLMMCWKAFRGNNYGLKRSRMMIRDLTCSDRI